MLAADELPPVYGAGLWPVPQAEPACVLKQDECWLILLILCYGQSIHSSTDSLNVHLFQYVDLSIRSNGFVILLSLNMIFYYLGSTLGLNLNFWFVGVTSKLKAYSKSRLSILYYVNVWSVTLAKSCKECPLECCIYLLIFHCWGPLTDLCAMLPLFKSSGFMYLLAG